LTNKVQSFGKQWDFSGQKLCKVWKLFGGWGNEVGGTHQPSAAILIMSIGWRQLKMSKLQAVETGPRKLCRDVEQHWLEGNKARHIIS
jgi:hypothetical protein